MGASHRLQWLTLIVAALVVPCANIIFGKGFFPLKATLPGLATYAHGARPVPAPFDKVVFMVIDALRADFVYGDASAFGFTQSLLRRGAAVPFTAHATSPTITLPRVKAITTGSIPSFLDVILNFAESADASSLAAQDTWLAQLRARGGDLVMYGDDTWLHLFPDVFKRSDGTSSFFVSDFFEVDNNVTRHVRDELGAKDWDGWVMHYLGLDHIGHKAGPASPFMPPKQREMDAIVKEIYTAIETRPHLQRTLFVLAGDHGMNDDGNHGGSRPGETSPALLFMSPLFKKINPGGIECPTGPVDGGQHEFDYYKTVEQSDIAPTLAGLLGFPVPRNNLGVFIPEFLGMWDEEHRIQLLRENAEQLGVVVESAYPGFPKPPGQAGYDCSLATSQANELSCRWNNAAASYSAWKNDGIETASNVQLSYLAFAERAQQILSTAASNYDLTLMFVGMSLSTSATLTLCAALYPLLSRASAGSTFLHLLTTAAYAVMMFASSYVEEEQHFWYWSLSGLLLLSAITSRRQQASGAPFLLTLALLRVARRWNQTGQKHAGAPDIARHWMPQHTTVLWVLVLATYLQTMLSLATHVCRRLGKEAAWVYTFTAAFGAASFKISYAAREAPEMVPQWLQPAVEAMRDITLVDQARAVFAIILVGGLYTYVFETQGDEEAAAADARAPAPAPAPPSADAPPRAPPMPAEVFHDLMTLFLLTQSRVANIPLFLVFRLVQHLVAHAAPAPVTLSLLLLMAQHASFYALGNANAISAVDLSNAYNGVAGYNLAVVSALTWVGNWAGPIFWASAAPLLVAKCAAAAAAAPATPVDGARVNGAAAAAAAAVPDGVKARPPPPPPPPRGVSAAQDRAWTTHSLLSQIFHGAAVVAVMAACTALRSHLFVWTVFSPKYLYAMVWSGVHQGIANAAWGAFVWRVRRRARR